MSDLVQQLRAAVGRPGAPEVAWDPVNQPMIRHWCDAMEDDHPAYTDAAWAAASPHGGIVAPPAMLNAWTMPGLRGRRRGGPSPYYEALRATDAAGFTSVVATNSEHAYPRYLRLGDHLRGTTLLEEVSEEKRTALGVGHFLTTRTDYHTADGELVGQMRFRILKFRPGTGRAAAAAPAAGEAQAPPEPPPRPVRREAPLAFAELAERGALAPCPVLITTTLIVAGAIASRDYQDVHHDRDLAHERGSPDIFMNILTTSGLVARYVTDQAGPTALLRALRIRLGAPNYPGDAMVLEGRVAARRAAGRGGVVEVAVTGTNRLGPHVTGTLELELPS